MAPATLKNLAACLALVASLAAAARAQESAFQDAKEGSSIFLRSGGGFAQVNPTDKSIKLGFLRDRGGKDIWYGIDFTGKASGGFATLFNGGTPSTEAEVGVTLGKRFGTVPSDEDIIMRCIAQTAEELKTTNLSLLVSQFKKDFIDERRQALTEQFQAELDEVDEQQLTIDTWREIFDAEKKKDPKMSDAMASGIATAAAPKAVEAKLEKKGVGKVAERAEARARLEAEQQPDLIKAEALRSAKGEASNYCADEEPDLERESYDWFSFRAAYKRASYKLLNETGAFADQVRKQNFDGFSAKLAYNRLHTFDDLSEERARRVARRAARLSHNAAPKEEERKNRDRQSKGSVILGVSIGVERKNNSDDLKSVDIEDQVFSSSNETTQRRALAKETALRGTYDEFIAVPLHTDVVWIPGKFDSRIAIDFFTRSNLGETDRKFVPGVGLFLTKEKSPTKVVGGISFSYDDGKGKVGLVGGFHF